MIENFQTKVESLFLNVLLVKKQIIKRNIAILSLNCIMQVSSILIFILLHAHEEFNASVTLFTESTLQIFSNNHEVIMWTASFNFALLGGLAVGLWMQLQAKESSYNQLTSAASLKFMKSISSYFFIVLEMCLIPSLVIIIIGIQNTSIETSPSSYFMGCVTILALFLLVFIEQNNLFGRYLVPILCGFLLPQTDIGSAIFLLAAFYKSLNCKNVLHRIVYLQLGWITLIQLVTRIIEIEICESHLALVTTFICCAAYLHPTNWIQKSQIDTNDQLLDLIVRMDDEKEVSSEELNYVTTAVESFQEKIEYIKNTVMRAEIQDKMGQLKKEITANNMKEFLLMKLNIEITEHPKEIVYKIQKMACRLKIQNFSMDLMYEMEQLRLSSNSELTYSDKLRFLQLMAQIESRFTQSQQTIDSKLVASLEKKVEKLYECVSEIITHHLYIWRTLQTNSMEEVKLFEEINSIVTLERESRDIIEKLTSMRDMRLQKDLYNYLFSLTNFQRESIFVKQDRLAIKQLKITHSNFILVANMQILDISYQIVSELHTVKSEIIQCSIETILPKRMITYMRENKNELMNNYKSSEIILPLKTFHKNEGILPFRCRFGIVPDMSQGFQYIIHVLNNSDLRKYPTFLYSINFDRIISVSPNFCSALDLQQIKPEYETLGTQLFGFDISSIISSKQLQVNSQQKCEVKMKRHCRSTTKIQHQKEISVNLRMIQNYSVGEEKIALLQLEDRDTERYIKTDTSIKNFLHLKENLVLENQKMGKMKKYSIGTNFCRIPNPYETLIDEKLSKPSSVFRLSYPKAVWILIAVVLGVVITGLVLLTLQVSTTGGELDTAIEANVLKNTCIQQVYLLFYQFYQYIHIRAYPAHYTAIQAYNMTKETTQYRKKANANIGLLLAAQIDPAIQQKELHYELVFKNFRRPQVTQTTSMIAFLEDTKQALVTNDPWFMVMNQHVTSTIIDSLQPVSLQSIANLVQFELFILIGCLLLIFFLMVGIKGIVFRIRSLIWDIFSIYQKLPKDKIVIYETNLEQLAIILQKSHVFHTKDRSTIKKDKQIEKKSHGSITSFKSSRQSLSLPDTPQKTINLNLKSQTIKRQTIFTSLMQYNIFMLIPIICTVYFISYFTQISNYQQESIAIIKYSDTLQNTITHVIEKSQKYYQKSMEEILPANQRKPWVKLEARNVATYFKTILPAYFGQYKQLEHKMLRLDLCAYSYLNTGSLYKNINCSLLLNGVMKTGFSQTYAVFIDMVEDFIGVQMKNMGSQFREGAKYPVFMQVAYVRRTVYNVLFALQKQFNKTVSAYIDYKNASLLSFIRFGYCLLIAIVIIAFLFSFQIRTLCSFTIKAFKILPRNFLLNISIAKQLGKTGILQRIEWLTL